MVGDTNSDLTTNSQAWTLIEILPSGQQQADLYSQSLPEAAMICMGEELALSFTLWKHITTRLEQMLALDSPWTKPKDIESEAFEDAQFSRSRRYFWAIKTLDRFIRCLESATTATQGFHDE